MWPLGISPDLRFMAKLWSISEFGWFFMNLDFRFTCYKIAKLNFRPQAKGSGLTDASLFHQQWGQHPLSSQEGCWPKTPQQLFPTSVLLLLTQLTVLSLLSGSCSQNPHPPPTSPEQEATSLLSIWNNSAPFISPLPSSGLGRKHPEKVFPSFLQLWELSPPTPALHAHPLLCIAGTTSISGIPTQLLSPTEADISDHSQGSPGWGKSFDSDPRPLEKPSFQLAYTRKNSCQHHHNPSRRPEPFSHLQLEGLQWWFQRFLAALWWVEHPDTAFKPSSCWHGRNISFSHTRGSPLSRAMQKYWAHYMMPRHWVKRLE